jgi:hypothetical protein
MQTADTVQQRLNRVYQQHKNVTIGHLLTVVQSADDIRSYAFFWAVCKLSCKLGGRSQDFQDLRKVLQILDHYG